MQNILILPVAVPGSGKSSFGKFLERMAFKCGVTTAIHSTDDKFIVNGEYKFDARNLGYNHNLNLKNAEESFKNGINYVYIDNTNLRLRDRKQYIDASKPYDYLIAEIFFIPGNLEDHYCRNIHDVPLAKINEMINIFNNNPMPSGLATHGLTFYVSPSDIPGSEQYYNICEHILKTDLIREI